MDVNICDEIWQNVFALEIGSPRDLNICYTRRFPHQFPRLLKWRLTIDDETIFDQINVGHDSIVMTIFGYKMDVTKIVQNVYIIEIDLLPTKNKINQ